MILSSSSWSKTTLCNFEEQIWLPNRKCYGKNKLYFDQEEIGNDMEKINSVLILSLNREKLSLHLSQHLKQVINCRGQHSMYRINYKWHHSFL